MQDALQEMSNAENYKKAFKPHLIRWSIVYAILITCIIFIPISITIRNWDFSQRLISWLLDMGAIYDGMNIHFSIITFGAVTFGIVPFVINGAGVFAFGVNVAGVFAFGVNAVGIIAIGTNAVGVIAIGCNAYGIVAIGIIPFGFYVLSYSESSRGKYLLAPHRQDDDAIDLFSRWFPKLTASLSTQ